MSGNIRFVEAISWRPVSERFDSFTPLRDAFDDESATDDWVPGTAHTVVDGEWDDPTWLNVAFDQAEFDRLVALDEERRRRANESKKPSVTPWHRWTRQEAILYARSH